MNFHKRNSLCVEDRFFETCDDSPISTIVELNRESMKKKKMNVDLTRERYRIRGN